nr:hypothetical protein [uncultured Pseudomonas sp.]
METVVGLTAIAVALLIGLGALGTAIGFGLLDAVTMIGVGIALFFTFANPFVGQIAG